MKSAKDRLRCNDAEASEIPALFKAGTATVSFDAAKSGKIIPRFSTPRPVVAEIHRLRAAGLSAKQVARQLGVSIRLAYRYGRKPRKGNYCTRHGPKIPRNPPAVQGGHRDRVVRCRESGKIIARFSRLRANRLV